MTSLRLAEALGALSLATDLAAGQPSGTAIGATVLAVRLGRRMGLSETALADLYYASIARRIGCTSTASLVAPMALGDERSVNRALNLADLSDSASVEQSLDEHLPRGTPEARSAAIAGIACMGAALHQAADAHCVQAVALTNRLPVPRGVPDLLAQVDARWDGKNPLRAAGADIPLGTRLMEFAAIAELHRRVIGPASAIDVASARAGSQFDPDVAAHFLSDFNDLTRDLHTTGDWQAFLDSEPVGPLEIDARRLRTVALAFADFADHKSRYFAGHSRRVAALAFSAAVAEALDEADCQRIYDAGLLHDIGKCAVPTGLWEAKSALDPMQTIESESHTFHTARILAVSPVFADIAECAPSVHERSDGSGYHRRIRLSDPASSLLAAANLYDELTHVTAARAALSPTAAARVLKEEVASGRLPAVHASAVIRAAGHRVKEAPKLPAGLTPREADVLRYIARGESGKSIANALGIAPKTVEKHSENIFRKIGVKNRTAATLFAMENGLLDR